MIEVGLNLFVGDQLDFERLPTGKMAVVHACKEPHHRAFVGYSGRGAPADHPEYLVARRFHRMALNLVDIEDVAYIHGGMIGAACAFIDEHHAMSIPVLVHCNQGRSRAPSIALFYLAGGEFRGMPYTAALAEFQLRYPMFAPAKGVRDFVMREWCARAHLS